MQMVNWHWRHLSCVLFFDLQPFWLEVEAVLFLLSFVVVKQEPVVILFLPSFVVVKQERVVILYFLFFEISKVAKIFHLWLVRLVFLAELVVLLFY